MISLTMSDFKFDCPKCGQNIVCDTSNAGMNIPCPVCKTMITIPRPPEPEPAPPGKLSINKSQAQHHAPPSASQPAGTTWAGAKTQAAPPQKNKPKWLKPVITCAILIVVAAVAWFAVGAPMLKARQEKARQEKEEAQRQIDEKAKAEAEAAAKAKRERASYSLDLANVDFPERVASGRIHGVNFKTESALFQKGVLDLKQDTAPACQFVLYLQTKPGESPAGKSFNVTSDDTNKNLQVVFTWKDDTGKPMLARFSKGYALKLQFDEGDSPLHGKIFLCTPDVEQSFVAGDFQCGTGVVQAAQSKGAAQADKFPPKKHKPKN